MQCYLRRIEGVPYAKGELGSRELHRFILDRHKGSLEYKESMLEAMHRDLDRSSGRRSRPTRSYRPYEHTLVPDPERLEDYLASLLGMMNQLYHRAAAFFEIVPVWLRFLERRRLVSADTRNQTLHELRRLADHMVRLFKDFNDDPHPLRALESWRKDAAKGQN